MAAAAAAAVSFSISIAQLHRAVYKLSVCPSVCLSHAAIVLLTSGSAVAVASHDGLCQPNLVNFRLLQKQKLTLVSFFLQKPLLKTANIKILSSDSTHRS